MISKLENYRHNLSLIGITIDELLLLNLYQNLPINVQVGAKVILLPIAAKEGVVYAMDNITGDLVPFSFSRASSATLFDKDKNMELVGNNIPRIDYGNYTDDVKLLVEKGSTNLFRDSNLALNNNKTSGFDTLIDFDWHGCLLSTKASELRLDTGTSFYYKNYAIKADTPYSVSLFASLNAQEKPVISTTTHISNDGYLNLVNGYTYISSLFSGKNVYRVGRSRMSGAAMSWSGFVKNPTSINRKINVSGYQLEEQETATSYIPTTTTSATRAADLLTYTLPASSGIYLKTTKQNTLLNKPKGLWNIHDDLNNEGIEALAIFYEDIIIGFDEETAVEEFIIPIRDKNQVVKARYALKDTDIEKNTLMGEHYIEISFALDIFFKFVRSDYIIWEGEKYIIKEDYIPDEVNKCNYKYTLRFDHWTTLLQDDTFYYMNQGLEEAEWSLMSNAATHFQLLADNANRYFGVNSFNVGTIEFTELKYIRFDKVSIWDAATQIAEEYGGEWYLTGTTFHLVKKFSYGSEIDFESEVSVEKMERSEGENSEKYTRILAFGSTRNIPANYRETTPGEAVDAIYQKRLRIPASKGKFIDAKPNMSAEEIKSAVVIFDEVYPKRIGTIGTVGTIPYQDTDTDTGVVTNWNAYKFKDTGIVFSEDYLLPGVELMLVFQSGNLNGMDFAVKFHKNGFSESDNSQYFEIVRNEDYGKPLPNDILKPQNGDTYILYGFNIQLVSDQYIPEGEEELYDTAVEWQQDMLKDKSVFECPTMIQHFEDNEMDLEIGQKVKLIHDQFEGGFRSSRIQGYEKHLLNKYQARYIVGDNATASWAKSVDNSIKELQIAGVTYQATGKNGVYLITQFDNTPASDFNTYSAKASDARYLNKQTGGTVQGDVLFQKKIKAKEAISDQFGNETFVPGMLGNGFRFWIENGLSFGQIDYLTVTREMLISVLTVAEVKSVDGGILISSANMVCSNVEDITTGYKCYFDNDGGNIPNRFVVGDQAMCRRFNGANVKYYWRLVTEVGADYILLSKTDKDGSGIPEAKDNIVHFGNRTDTQRQFAIYSVAYGDAGTFYYYGVNSYDLTGKAKTYFSKSGARIDGDSIVFSSSGKSAATAISEVETKASNAQTSANTANAGLLSKVAYSEYNAQMQVLNTQISSKVSQTDFNTLDGRVASTESSITQQAGQISSVVTQVNTAQTTADSKTRTYYQDVQPTTPSGGFSVGDIWQKVTYTDTTGVVNMDSSKNVCRFEYRWNGTTWVQINFNVSGSYVTQTNDSISSLVTKTGINSLGAGETLKSLIDQTPDKITLAVSAIQIGGVNQVSNMPDNWIQGAYEGGAASYFNHPEFICTPNPINVKPNSQYVISAENGYRIDILEFNSGVYLGVINTGNPVLIKTSVSTTTVKLNIYKNPRIPIVPGDIINSILKLEEGNKATAWSPSLEDTQSQIDGKTTLAEVVSKLSITDNKITLDTKTIELNGTTIAKAIQAGELNVGKFKVGVDGKVYAVDGEFSGKITSTTGTIGGFDIGSNRIGTTASGTETSSYDGLALYNDFIKFSTSGGIWSGIGTNVLPATAGIKAVARFINGENNPYGGTNIGIHVGASGATDNVAINMIGGYISGLALKTSRINSSQTLSNGDVFISCGNGSNITLTLPSNPEKGKMYFIQRINVGTVTINGNGKSIYTSRSTNPVTGYTLYEETSQMGSYFEYKKKQNASYIVFDGQYWHASIIENIDFSAIINP